ncbi:MAG: M50 family metallopeptidase [Saprospiraceae bacterium]
MIGSANPLHFRLWAMLLIYLILRFVGGSLGQLVLYPVTLLVTFLHEFGHALGAIITGGEVVSLQVSPDGSGYTTTRGGSSGLILMGGYVGSAVLGNLLFRIGVKYKRFTQTTLLLLAGIMALVGVVWFESIISTAILFGFALVLYAIVRKTNWEQDVLMFLGLATVLYILQDFRVGPGGDLQQYERVVGLFPSQVWMYIWLVLVLLITLVNLRALFFRPRAQLS